MKNIILIHGYNGIPKIFEYFKNILEKDNYNVIIPSFPTKTNINIKWYFDVLDKYKNYFNNECIVVAHSIGNIMFLKYICQYNLKINLYISLAGFSRPFIVEGKDDLNNVIAPLIINEAEENKCKKLIKNKYSIYSYNDHIVPLDILKQFSEIVDSTPVFIKGIGHMGKKIGLESLPEVVDIIKKY